ncbi:hypothetical protein [Paenibacillus terreus]
MTGLVLYEKKNGQGRMPMRKKPAAMPARAEKKGFNGLAKKTHMDDNPK